MADLNRRKFLIVSTTLGSALTIPSARGAGAGTVYRRRHNDLRPHETYGRRAQHDAH
jgi:hypothetical protein